MRVYITRHGQTDLNKKKRMQGRIDEPLNETGRAQALSAGKQLEGIPFDAVYASPLRRAIETAELMSGLPREKIATDARLMEVDFGRYERKSYFLLGPAMVLYWALPEIFPAPKTVEPISAMSERIAGFLRDLQAAGCENVLIVCHGGIMRVLSGQLEHRKNGLKWRPKPENTEIRVYEL